MSLFLRNLLWTILCPGTVTVLLPFLFFKEFRAGSFSWNWHNALGVLLILPGAIALFRCIYDFAQEGRGTLSPADPARHLVVKGLYRYVRNPMYVGVMGVLLGEALCFASMPLLCYAGIVFLLFNMFVRLYEEPYLRQHFGAEYTQYCQKVRRWWPMLHPEKA